MPCSPAFRSICRPRAALLALIAFLLLLPGSGAAAQPSAPACTGDTIHAPVGPICGVLDTAVVAGTRVVVPAYRGIRYAQAPTGSRRWAAPEPVADTAGVRAATAMGPACPQEGSGVPMSEDCLSLNVWVPPSASAARTAPVMVFIHGGAFVVGRGSAPIYNGAYLAAAESVVVVTLNYRLGALGFLRSTDHGTGIGGNFGLLDQQAALRWVRRNIGAFGGDSERVTLFGESAGAMSVGFHHFTMPSSEPLFRASIMESNPMGTVYRGPAAAQTDGTEFIRTLCHLAAPRLVDCALPLAAAGWFNHRKATLPTDTLLMAQARFDASTPVVERFLRGGLKEGLPWTPVVDGTLVRGQPLRGYATGIPRKPYVFGFNRDEGVLFAAGAKNLTHKEYDRALDLIFGVAGASRVRGYKVEGNHLYSAATDSSVAGMSPVASALSNLIGHMVFDCGNLAAADAGAVAAATGGPPPPPVYGYLFERTPVPFALYGDAVPECTAAAGTVCHGDELPYVFNTLAAVPSGGAPAPADTSLARQMAAAWGAFARNPGAPPVAGWPAYGSARSLFSWSGEHNGPLGTNAATAANCTQLWFTLPPLHAGG